MRLQLTHDGTRSVADRLEGIGHRADHPEPALRQVADELRKDAAYRFATGRGWRKLDPDTIAIKRRKGLPPQRLVASGRLRASLTGSTSDSIQHISSTSLVWGTSVSYARFHQLGKGQPRRRVVSVMRTTRRRIPTVMHDHVVGSGARIRIL